MPTESDPRPPQHRLRTLAPQVHLARQRSQSGLTVSYYLLEGDEGVTLIDTGFPNRVEAVSEALAAIGRGLSDVVRVIYTHTHIDHMGGGPALAQACPAEHVVWHASLPVAADWQAHQRRLMDWRPWIRALVPEGPMREALRGRYRTTLADRTRDEAGASAIAPARGLHPGQRVTAGPYRLEALPAPGHDPQHVVLYDRDARVVFSGDLVLPVPTPIARPMGDDTASYLASLDRLEDLQVVKAYPGHGAPFASWSRRLAFSRDFVEQRHAAIRELLAESGPQSVFELGRALSRRPPDEGDPPVGVFLLILANVDSSVHYLEACGELVREAGRVGLPG